MRKNVGRVHTHHTHTFVIVLSNTDTITTSMKVYGDKKVVCEYPYSLQPESEVGKKYTITGHIHTCPESWLLGYCVIINIKETKMLMKIYEKRVEVSRGRNEVTCLGKPPRETQRKFNVRMFHTEVE